MDERISSVHHNQPQDRRSVDELKLYSVTFTRSSPKTTQPNPNDTGAVGGISFTHQLLHQRKTNYASTDSKTIAINTNNSTVLFTYTFT